MARVDGLNGPVDSKLGEPKESIRVHDVQGFDLARQREVAMMEQATTDTIESNKQRDWLSSGAFQMLSAVELRCFERSTDAVRQMTWRGRVEITLAAPIS